MSSTAEPADPDLISDEDLQTLTVGELQPHGAAVTLAEYDPALEAAGFTLRIREPEWFEHRVFKGTDPSVNLHVFSAGAAEIDRMRRFRDWLRVNREDRELYARTKRELDGRTWRHVQHYADAKTAVIQEIRARAEWAERR